MSELTASQTGIHVDTDFFPLAFFLFLCTPVIEIDGVAQQRPWGAHFFPATPGVHRLWIWFGYLGIPQCGLNGIDVTVAEGRVAHVKYFMPPWMLARGQVQLVDESGLYVGRTVVPAGWNADPTARHQLRYWDGARWTSFVSDDGVQSTDPL
ncbi:MAG: DUF2510 domain-containing protein [Actinomycetota bacterium]|nr:MAG: hypothetical protein FD171_281 [Actinomycetota bacterium]MDO8949400.1 DUF2510 domain-containing protein [Actinomycetota bacterium]MDP3631253.1 DUF2510 domain-containing protein [Actinomycetota bacterium]